VRFAGVELDVPAPRQPDGLGDGRGIQVALAGARDEVTMRRDGDFELARVAWAERLRELGRDGAGDPPSMPGVAVLQRVQAVVTDDVGTSYPLVAGRVAGDGTEWEAWWVYAARPPRTARRLHLRFTVDGEPTGRDVVVALD
jgi:hypothetical protein